MSPTMPESFRSTRVRETRQAELREVCVFVCSNRGHWARRAHEKALQSKAAGPLSGSEDTGVEQVTLRRYEAGRGAIADRGNL